MKTLFFDLDNTLYPYDLGVVARIDRRINQYLCTRIGILESEVDALRRRFWADYGTTLGGLLSRHSVNPDDFLEYIHDIELADLLKPDPGLRALLDRLPGKKAIFTNASRAHAVKVLRLLDLEDSFATVIALEDRAYVPKPMADAYHAVLSHLGADARDSVLIDDTRMNLAPAKRLGMRTFWLSETTDEERDEGIDHVIASLHEIEAILAPETSTATASVRADANGERS